MVTRQRSPSPAKPVASAHPPLAAAAAAAAAARLSHFSVLPLLVAAALLLWAVSGVPLPMRMPMHLHRMRGAAALGSGHHAQPDCGSMPGSLAAASSGALGAAAAPSSSSSCETPRDVTAPSPFARSCTLLRDACVDQERVILYGPQNSTQPWQLAPSHEHAKFVFELADPLVSTARSMARHSMEQLSTHLQLAGRPHVSWVLLGSALEWQLVLCRLTSFSSCAAAGESSCMLPATQRYPTCPQTPPCPPPRRRRA